MAKSRVRTPRTAIAALTTPTALAAQAPVAGNIDEVRECDDVEKALRSGVHNLASVTARAAGAAVTTLPASAAMPAVAGSPLAPSGCITSRIT